MEKINKVLENFVAKTKVDAYALSNVNGEIIKSNQTAKKEEKLGIVNALLHQSGEKAYTLAKKSPINNITISTKNAHILGQRNNNILLFASTKKGAKVDLIHKEMARVTKRLEKLI